MKVYVLTIEEVCDYEQVKQKPQLFYTDDDARAELKKCRDTLLKSIQGLTWIIETDEDDNFRAYELGREAANRFSAHISECEVICKKPPFFERYAALKREEIDCLRVALEKVGGSYRFGNNNIFLEVLTYLDGFSDDYEFCVVRSAEIDNGGNVFIEVEANYQTYRIDAFDVMGGYIHYITEEIEA